MAGPWTPAARAPTSAAIPTRLARARLIPVRARRSPPRMGARSAHRSGSRHRSRQTRRASPASGRMCVTFGRGCSATSTRATSTAWNAPASPVRRILTCRGWWVRCAIPATASAGPSRGARPPTRSASRARVTTPSPGADAPSGAWCSGSMSKTAVSQGGPTDRRCPTGIGCGYGSWTRTAARA